MTPFALRFGHKLGSFRDKVSNFRNCKPINIKMKRHVSTYNSITERVVSLCISPRTLLSWPGGVKYEERRDGQFCVILRVREE